jgi:hypothetical protein
VIKKHKIHNIRNYNFACGFVWVCNLASDIKGKTKTNGIRDRMWGEILRPKEGEIIGGWRKMYNEELQNLYSSPYVIRIIISRRMRWTRGCSTHGNEDKYIRILVGELKGKRPLGKPIHRWEDNFKMDLSQDGVVWAGLI